MGVHLHIDNKYTQCKIKTFILDTINHLTALVKIL